MFPQHNLVNTSLRKTNRKGFLPLIVSSCLLTDVVYADASPMVISVLDGYNVCIFAYGQTGTGKTFTMEGTKGNRGVNYRTLEELFKIAKERSETFTYDISVSVLEVYNEQIRDLLSPPTTSKKYSCSSLIFSIFSSATSEMLLLWRNKVSN